MLGSRLILQLTPSLVIITLWQSFIVLFPRYEFFLGSPVGFCREFRTLLLHGTLVRDIGVTTLEAVLGFLSGSLLGTVVGLGMWSSRTAYVISQPYLIALGSVPVFALGPVLIFWFGTGILSKVVLGFLATLVIAIVQAYTGAMEADSNLLRLTRAFGGNDRQIFLKIIVPSATIWVLSGVRLNIGMSLLGAFVGEFISSNKGLGYLIIVAEGLYNVNQIWVGCFCIVAIAVVFHASTIPVERWAKRHQ